MKRRRSCAKPPGLLHPADRPPAPFRHLRTILTERIQSDGDLNRLNCSPEVDTIVKR